MWTGFFVTPGLVFLFVCFRVVTMKNKCVWNWIWDILAVVTGMFHCPGLSSTLCFVGLILYRWSGTHASQIILNSQCLLNSHHICQKFHVLKDSCVKSLKTLLCPSTWTEEEDLGHAIKFCLVLFVGLRLDSHPIHLMSPLFTFHLPGILWINALQVIVESRSGSRW